MNSDHEVAPQIQGYCHPKFAAVKAAFENNFRAEGEIGAATTIIHNGEMVVDLWAGHRDIGKSLPWDEDTLVCLMSTSKAIASIAVLSLVDQGELQLDHPISAYWPEFAGGNKSQITVRELLAQIAGLPVAENAPRESYLDLRVLEQAFNDQQPLWEPGSTPCYHSFTYGPLCQLLIEKVTGQTLGAYLRDSLFGPLNIEFYVGLQEPEIARCADIILEDNIPSLNNMRTPGTMLHRAWIPAPIDRNIFQEDSFRRAEFASANGHGNARSLAQIYHQLCDDLNRGTRQLLSADTLREAIKEQWNAEEKISNRRFRFSTGFMLNNPFFAIGRNQRSFGHPGLGGPTGFADPDANLGFGYCCNLIRATDNTGPCATALINATYDSL